MFWSLDQKELLGAQEEGSNQPHHLPPVSNDTNWDFCSTHHSTPRPQHTSEQMRLYPTGGSGESEEGTEAKKEKATD